jgi:hypothetical protein
MPCKTPNYINPVLLRLGKARFYLVWFGLCVGWIGKQAGGLIYFLPMDIRVWCYVLLRVLSRFEKLSVAPKLDVLL